MAAASRSKQSTTLATCQPASNTELPSPRWRQLPAKPTKLHLDRRQHSRAASLLATELVMARPEFTSSNSIPTSFLTTINADAGHIPSSVAPANASNRYESLAASTRNSSAGNEYASGRGIVDEQYDFDDAANSAASDCVPEYVAAATALISAEYGAVSASSAASDCSSVDGLAAAESGTDNATAAVFAAATDIRRVTFDIPNGCTASAAKPTEYIPADYFAWKPTYSYAGISADTSCPAKLTVAT